MKRRATMIIPKRSQTASEVLGTGFRIWKETFFEILPFALIAGIVLGSTPLIFWEEAGEMHLSRTVLSLQPIVNLVLSCILTGAIIYRIDAIVKHKDLGLKHALYVGFKKAPLYFLAMALYFLAILGGLVLFIIPGLILFVSLMFAPYLVILTEVGIVDSIKESYRLVSKNWWYTGWVMLLFSLVCLAFVILVASMGVSIFSMILQNPKVIASIIGIVICTIFVTYLNANMLALLYDLQVKKALRKTSSIAA